VRGSVRAVDLAHILDRSADSEGRWRCALCHAVVTLDDLSFDHVVALADGGEHAPHNLVPAHRKCNEIKGSEKAQYRAQALDRWLSDWAATTRTTASPLAAELSAPQRGGYLVGSSARPEDSVRRYA
jgi:5-methylcytosine-specific restriction endonuclease McrA